MSIDSIRELWRERQDHHKEEKALTLRVKARLRRLCDGDKTEAGKLYKSMMTDGAHPLADYALALNERLIECRKLLEGHRKGLEKQLVSLAKELPVASFVEEVPGFSYLSLAAIVVVWIQFNTLHRRMNRGRNLTMSSVIAVSLALACLGVLQSSPQ